MSDLDQELLRRNRNSWIVIAIIFVVACLVLFFIPPNLLDIPSDISVEQKVSYLFFIFFVSCTFFLPIKKFGPFNRILVFTGGVTILAHFVYLVFKYGAPEFNAANFLIILSHLAPMVFFYWKTKFLINR